MFTSRLPWFIFGFIAIFLQQASALPIKSLDYQSTRIQNLPWNQPKETDEVVISNSGELQEGPSKSLLIAASIIGITGGAFIVAFMCGSNEKTIVVAPINPTEMNRPAVAKTYPKGQPRGPSPMPIDPRIQQQIALEEQRLAMERQRMRQEVERQNMILQEKQRRLAEEQRKQREFERKVAEDQRRRREEEKRAAELAMAYNAMPGPIYKPVEKPIPKPPTPKPAPKPVAQVYETPTPEYDSGFDSSKLGWVGRTVCCTVPIRSNRSDELDLDVGDQILVEKVSRSGIAQGKLLKNGNRGYFPVDNVRLLKLGEVPPQNSQNVVVPARKPPSSGLGVPSNAAQGQTTLGVQSFVPGQTNVNVSRF